MPYKFQTDKVHLTKQQDRRIKLTDQQKIDICNAHYVYGQSIHSLSREYKVNRRLIQFILFPDRQKHNVDLRQKRGGWQQYYDKEKHTTAVREHRRYKHKILEESK